MAQQKILTDLTGTDDARKVYVDHFNSSLGELSGLRPGCSIVKRRLQGGLQDNVDVIEIKNGALRFTVVPTRGMGIHRARLGNLILGWQSPVRGPVHPSFVPVNEPGGLGFLWGFDELLCRCGLSSNGAPDFDEQGRLTYPLHGRIANRPAHYVSVSVDQATGEIAIFGEVDETRMFSNLFRLSTTIKTLPGEKGFRIHDEVKNLSALAAEMQLLYHVNFGAPLCVPGSMLEMPIECLAPRDADAATNVANWHTYGPAETGFGEHVNFAKLHGSAGGGGCTAVLLSNPDGRQGIVLRYNTVELPYFTQWIRRAATADGYVTGLEPATNFPNQRTFEGEHGRFLRLDAGESAVFNLSLTFCPNPVSVSEARAVVQSLQEHGGDPQIHNTPIDDWSPNKQKED